MIYARERAVSASCPFCKAEITEGEVIFCCSCLTAHHLICWQENNSHCSIFCCNGAQTVDAHAMQRFGFAPMLGIFFLLIFFPLPMCVLIGRLTPYLLLPPEIVAAAATFILMASGVHWIEKLRSH